MANRQTTLVLLGTVLAVAALGVASLSSDSSQIAQVIEGLQSISIPIPEGGGTYGLEDPVRLTALGDVGTSTLPIRASWYYMHATWQSMREIPGCTNVKTCSFTFNGAEEAGRYAVTADASDHYATVFIVIEERLTNPFQDEQPGWAQEAIIRMSRLGIIRGYDNGSFGPGDPVTRAQMVTLLARLLGARQWLSYESCSQANFSDVAADHFARAPLCAFEINGWVDAAAVTQNRFDPDAPSSRAFTAGLVARSTRAALEGNGQQPSDAVVFDDVTPNHPFFADIQMVSSYGLMTGNPNGDFAPEGRLNRAEAAVILYRIWSKLARPGDGATSAAPVSSQAAAENGEPENGQPCDDGSYCTVGEALRAGRCVGGSIRDCDDGNDCTNDSCVEGRNNCMHANNTLLCDDGDANTVDDRCNGGQCRGSPKSAPSVPQSSAAASVVSSAGANISTCGGSEVNLNTNRYHCGSCGTICPHPNHAYGICSNATCVLGGCMEGWRNLDGNDANGCEGAPL